MQQRPIAERENLQGARRGGGGEQKGGRGPGVRVQQNEMGTCAAAGRRRGGAHASAVRGGAAPAAARSQTSLWRSLRRKGGS
jgi:hypothetical protein